MCNWSGWCGWCGWCRCHIEYPAHKMQQKKQQSGYILWRLAYNMNIMLVLFTQLLLFVLSQLLSFLLWEVCDLCHFTSHSLRVVLDLACRHTSLYARGLGLFSGRRPFSSSLFLFFYLILECLLPSLSRTRHPYRRFSHKCLTNRRADVPFFRVCQSLLINTDLCSLSNTKSSKTVISR